MQPRSLSAAVAERLILGAPIWLDLLKSLAEGGDLQMVGARRIEPLTPSMPRKSSRQRYLLVIALLLSSAIATSRPP